MLVFDPVALLSKAYEPPDSGTHQLADLPGAEIIFLNDFTWDEAWMKWAYFKGHVGVAAPHWAIGRHGPI